MKFVLLSILFEFKCNRTASSHKVFEKKDELISNIHKRKVKVYGGSYPSLSTVIKWAAEFKRGIESLDDDQRSGGHQQRSKKEKIEAVLGVIIDDCRVIID